MYKLVVEKYALKNIAKINPSHLTAIKVSIATNIKKDAFF